MDFLLFAGISVCLSGCPPSPDKTKNDRDPKFGAEYAVQQNILNISIDPFDIRIKFIYLKVLGWISSYKKILGRCYPSLIIIGD